MDESNLTSQQYAYRLLRRLQRSFRCITLLNRYYCLNYFGEVFESPGITITYAQYLEFCTLMDQDVEYCATKGLNTLYQITNDSGFSGQFALLQRAFAAINCQLSYNRNNYTLTIQTPDGIDHTLEGTYLGYDDSNTAIEDEATMNHRLRATDSYWTAIQSTYELTLEPLIGLDEIELCYCGPNAIWRVDGDTVFITGNGYIVPGAGNSLMQAKSAVFKHFQRTRDKTIFILGADINELKSLSFDGYTNITFVCLRAEDDPMTLASNWHSGDTKTAKSWTIYTDNLALRNFNFGRNFTVTWHSLSEWEGE